MADERPGIAGASQPRVLLAGLVLHFCDDGVGEFCKVHWFRPTECGWAGRKSMRSAIISCARKACCTIVASFAAGSGSFSSPSSVWAPRGDVFASGLLIYMASGRRPKL